MTDQELKVLSPLALNEAVARKLHPDEIIIISRAKNYCHSIEAAWEIVEQINQTYGFVLGKSGNKWIVSTTWDNDIESIAEADTAPMAICLAFLKLEA